MKLPVPVPSVVLSFPIVGEAVVAQQIPLADIGVPPSSVIFPPEVAVDAVIDEMEVVVIVGNNKEFVVNDSSFPYPIPTPLTA